MGRMDQEKGIAQTIAQRMMVDGVWGKYRQKK